MEQLQFLLPDTDNKRPRDRLLDKFRRDCQQRLDWAMPAMRETIIFWQARQAAYKTLVDRWGGESVLRHVALIRSALNKAEPERGSNGQCEDNH